MQLKELEIKKEWIFCGLIWLMVFQSPLETVSSIFKYIDEALALIGIFLLAKKFLCRGQITASKDTIIIVCLLAIFVISGLTGNFLYKYQPLKAVIIDLITNIKFYCTILTGYYLCYHFDWNRMKKISNISARLMTALLFVIFLMDRVLNIFPGQIRYGIKSAQLFYIHPTYLAGAVIFLLALLTIFYERKNFIYILCCCVITVFTLRSKSFGAIAVFCVLFVFIKTFKKKIKLWQIALLGCCAIIVGWPMIHYYFVLLAGHSARSVMTLTSFRILWDYFPIGTGFGTYASSVAGEYYSPVYVKYGFEQVYELSSSNPNSFFSDTFWPIIIGQTGLIGTVSYLSVQLLLLKKCLSTYKLDKFVFLGMLFIMIYLFISSMAEPTFNNSISMSLAFTLGMIFGQYRMLKEQYI